MRNLFLFLLKQRNILLFIILEVIAGFLIVANNSYQRSKFISASDGFIGHFYAVASDFSSYFSLKKQNLILLKENERLRNKLKSSYISLDTNKIYFLDSVSKVRFQYMACEVIKNSFQKRDNYLMITKGRNQGVYPEMGLVSNSGILGIINKVSDNFSTAISILHSKTAIDAKLKKSGYTGTVSWNGKDYHTGQLENIPAHVKLHRGDTVVTSGNSSIFPKDLMIGTVKSFSVAKGAGFYDIEITFSQDYDKVHFGYVIFNRLKEQEDSLGKEVLDE